MNVALRRPMTVAEFLNWEQRQELRWEFDGVRPKATTGGTRAHSAIQRNLLALLFDRLRDKPCEPFGSDIKIEVAGSIRYPDALVVCTPGAPGETVIRDPVVVFEITSPSTQAADRGQKNREYRATPSIQRYVILEQDQVLATVFHRQGEDWVGHALYAEDVLALPEIGVEIPMADTYQGIEMTPPPAAETA